MAEFYNKVLFFRDNLKEVKFIIPFFLKHYQDRYDLTDLNNLYIVCEKIIFYCMVDCLNTYTYDSENPKFPNQNAIKNRVKQVVNLLKEQNDMFENAIKEITSEYIGKNINDATVINFTDCLLGLFINDYKIISADICIQEILEPDNHITKANRNKEPHIILDFYRKIENKLQTYFYDKDYKQFAFQNGKELLLYFKIIDDMTIPDSKILELSFLNTWKTYQEEYKSFKSNFIDTNISPDIISDLKMTTSKVDINPLMEHAIKTYQDKEEREKKQEEISNFKLAKLQKLAKLDKFREQFENIVSLEACAGAEKKMDEFFADIPNKNSKKIITLIKKGLNNVGIYDENKSSVDEIEESINRELESNSDE